MQTRIAYDLEQWTCRLADRRKSIEQLKSIATEEWGKDEELGSLKQQLADLDKRIKHQLDSEEGKQQAQKEDNLLPVKFTKNGRYHTAAWSRDVFSLVSSKEMRKVINDLPCYGYLSDTEWAGSQLVPLEEMEAEFSSNKCCADFIERIEKMQKERMKDRQWLSDKAKEDTGGDVLTIDNATIFAARKELAKMAA